ncbi:MAG: HAMP domain-containing histidine kinase [Bacteroidetes bacterium]|nr:HAMP domain-containing histidine kinase [Bacteroidota bacterium]
MELDNLLIINIINSGISFIMGLYMFYFYRNALKLGTGYWATGSIILGITFLLKTIFPEGSPSATATFTNFNTIADYLFLAGIWQFKEKKINKWIFIGIPILDILQTIIFFKIYPSLRLQYGLHSLPLFAFGLLAIIEMIRLNSTQKYLRKIFLVNSFSFIIYLVLLLIFEYALITNTNFDPLEITSSAIYMQIISSFLMITITFGFLSAVNIRLNKELENQLKSKTKFLTIIAHDLRGPVGNIISFLDLLQNTTNLNEDKKKVYLKILNTLSQSTFHLLQNLLEWATKSKNLNRFNVERIELSQIISDNIIFFKSSADLKSINLEFKEGKQTYILGNTNMIETIVRNLISNAIKFTPKEGTITITSEKILKKVRLTVADTGQGIKPETINSLFKFETNKSTKGTNGEGGSGLGLVLCKELVSNNNGLIEIESHEGVGTNVIVEFPTVE